MESGNKIMLQCTEIYSKSSKCSKYLFQDIFKTKTWGDEQDPLILCIHGIMDNAGTFDRLIPYLPNSFYYVSIDLPGHGQSSHFPPHLPVHTLNFVIVYRIIFRYFQKKFIIMGHSYGGQIGFLFAQMFPECVEKLIMLDTVSIFPVSTKNVKFYLSQVIDKYIEIDNKLLEKTPPTYTREEALHRLWTGRSYAPITLEAAKALLDRSIEPAGDGKYKFTLDQRMKNAVLPLRDFRYIIDVLKLHPARCPVLIILGSGSTAQQVLFSSVIQYLKRKKAVRIKYVNGNHDVHNDSPELVAPYVLKFLLWQKNKL